MSCTVTVLPMGATLIAEEGANLLEVLAGNGYFLPAACGGAGTCGKCRVKIVEGQVSGTPTLDDGTVLSCHAAVCTDLTVDVGTQRGTGLDRFDAVRMCGTGEGIGVILDIGTTTLAAAKVDLASGEILSRASSLNPQGVCGADVLSRIKAYGEGKGALLQELILKQTRELLETLDATDARELVVAANTTMLHLFLGVDPATIGVYPFTPVFTDTQVRSGAELGLSVGTVRLLPSASAYIGSDITAGALAVGMQSGGKTELFADVGTNGEILLSHKGRLYAASTAAGPALEGACIECGMGGVAGAIDHVSLSGGRLTYSTVERAPARGICGSGLIDLIALLVHEGIIDGTGAWDEESDSFLAEHLRDGRFYLTEDIYLSQGDIRQFQLAKSAIAAGLVTLLAENGVQPSEVETLYIAGGLGYYMNIGAAAATGLIPRALQENARAVGNTALAGARICLMDGAMQKEIERVAREIETVELSFSPVFQDAYMDNMMFSEE